MDFSVPNTVLEKTRKEKRREARLLKTEKQHQYRLKHQDENKGFSKPKKKELKKSSLDGAFERGKTVKEIDPKFESLSGDDNDGLSVAKRKRGSKNRKKTGFEKFIEMGAQSDAVSANEDFELERKLAKKLGLKSGKLGGEDDGFNALFGGFSSIFNSDGDEDEPMGEESSKRSAKRRRGDEKSSDGELLEVETRSDSLVEISEPTSKVLSKKKIKKRKESDGGKESIVKDRTSVEEVPSKAPQKYVAPHLRSRVGRTEMEEYSQIRRRVRGLLNRVSESNVESIVGEVSVIFRSMPRIIASQMVGEEVLASCSGGPRGNEQYAAVFAAFVAGMACSVGVDFSANLMASLAKNFEDEYHKEDNLSLRNLTLLLAYLCIFEVCSSDLMYDFITMLGQRLTEVDVSTILTVLQCCGMKIRADDPLSMKSFIASVQSRVNELKASSEENKDNINSKRMEFMLETIFDIKNNKKRPKEDSAHHTRIKKWLQKLRVEDTVMRGLTWSKLLDPDKKGLWWSSVENSGRDDVEEVAHTIDKEVLEAQKMLELAAVQRMNTDGRKAVFCIIMSSEDYIDAFEKLLRLDLPGKQDREVMRVLLDCCLQEKAFNKYYTVLASKLCEHEKNHKFTLQFCLWDLFKELESMTLLRSLNLAKFVVEMVASFSLSLAVLKVVDLNDIRKLTPKRIMHFRMLFEALFEFSDEVIWNVVTRVAVAPELESLRQGIEFFIKEYLLKNNKAISEKFKVLKKALNNAEGILM